MKVEINKNVLEHMLVNCQNFLDKKDSSSITSHVLLVSEDGNFKIKATDYEIGIFMQTSNYKSLQDGKASANGKKILDMVKVLKDDDVTLEVVEDNLIINQKRLTINFLCSTLKNILISLQLRINQNLR